MEKFGAEMDGNMGTTTLTKEQLDWLAPRTVEMDTLVQVMLDRTGDDLQEAKAGVTAIHGLFGNKLQFKIRLEFK
jgi:hypothetical protein